MKNVKKKTQNLFYFLFISNIYCLILGWFSGEDKLNYLGSYFFHFLTWWCVWNSFLTIVFVLWKLKNPNNNTYFSQVFTFVIMASNLISAVIYGMGIIIWLVTSLTNYWGLTNWTKNKLVPIPNHSISNFETDKQPGQILRVVRWWFYSPLWHFIAPTYFIVWFFRYAPKNYLKKKLKLTTLISFIMPTTYFLYCYLRSRFGDKTYFKDFGARWPYFFLSSKTMMKKLGVNGFRFVWKIILVLFWFSLFSLIAYFSIRFRVPIKKFFVNKKRRKQQHISFPFHKKI